MTKTNELTMRKLCGEDVFTMARIISMTDITELKNAVSKDADGKEVWLDMMHIVCGSLDRCRSEIVSFLASLYSVSEDEIKSLEPSELVRLIKKTVQSEGFSDFFTAVSELLLWA